MPGPLDGLKVVDVSWGMPGSVASLLLADHGAEVIKVERPGGGPDTEALYRKGWERGKKSIEIDFAADEDRQVFHALMKRADVLIEAFGPGRAEQLGFGYERLKDLNPGLIYCSITGYGQESPLKDRPGYDALVAARLGLMAEAEELGVGLREGPIFLGHPTVGYGTAFLASISILSALRARNTFGIGQFIDVSMLDGALVQSPMNWWWNEKGLSYIDRSQQSKSGDSFGHSRLITRVFKCRDGRYLQIHTGGPGGFKRTMDLLGLGGSVREITDRPEMAVPLNDAEYDAARNQTPEAFLSRDRDEWISLFHQEDLAALPVLEPGDALMDEQIAYSDQRIELSDPDFGRIYQAGPAVNFSRTAASQPNPAPSVGQHNEAIREMCSSENGETSVHDTGNAEIKHSAMDGVRILDLSSFFACGYGCKLLSDLGADVIKIETPGGEQMRPLPDPFEACNRGKRSLVLDLKSEAGRKVLYKLVGSVDIVVHNMRPGKAEKLGIGYEDLQKYKPNLVYAFMPGYGSQGPKMKLKSFAPLLSGFTGLLYEAGGEGNEPSPRALGNEDYYNGLLGANALLMGLYHRDLTGEGQYVECPQLHSSLFTTSEHFLNSEYNTVYGLRLDQDQTGFHALYRNYKCLDGWICLACVGERAFNRLGNLLNLSDIKISEADLLTEALGSWFSERTKADAFEILDSNGIACEIVRETPYIPELFWEDWAVDSNRVFVQDTSPWGKIREIGLTTHLSRTPGIKKSPAPELGQHSREIVKEIGFTEIELEELLESKAVVAST